MARLNGMERSLESILPARPYTRALSRVLWELSLNDASARNIESFDLKSGWSAYSKPYPRALQFLFVLSPTLVRKIEREVRSVINSTNV